MKHQLCLLGFLISMGLAHAQVPQPAGKYNDVSQLAILGDPQAQLDLADMLIAGVEVPRNPVLGFEWMFRAANAGNTEAMKRLADMYFLGQGIDVNDTEGLGWLLKAYDAGDVEAAFRLAEEWPRIGKALVNPKEVLEFIRYAATNGHPPAQTRYGQVFEKGLYGEKVNLKRAVEWYEKGSSNKDRLAKHELARCYSQGVGVQVNRSKATRLYAELAEMGDVLGMHQLGVSFMNGQGVRQNPTIAVALFTLATELQSEGYEPSEESRRQLLLGARDIQLDRLEKMESDFRKPGSLLKLIAQR